MYLIYKHHSSKKLQQLILRSCYIFDNHRLWRSLCYLFNQFAYCDKVSCQIWNTKHIFNGYVEKIGCNRIDKINNSLDSKRRLIQHYMYFKVDFRTQSQHETHLFIQRPNRKITTALKQEFRLSKFSWQKCSHHVAKNSNSNLILSCMSLEVGWSMWALQVDMGWYIHSVIGSPTSDSPIRVAEIGGTDVLSLLMVSILLPSR